PNCSDSPGATTTTYSFTATSADNGHQYRAVFTNTCGTANTTAATLTVNTPANVSITINDASVTEGNSGTTNATFTISLSTSSSTVVKVDYTTADSTATAGEDYTAATGTLTFQPGETTKTVNISVIGDTK